MVPSSLRFPFISCEIFTCEIDVILKTLVEEDEVFFLLSSFLPFSQMTFHTYHLVAYVAADGLAFLLSGTKSSS